MGLSSKPKREFLRCISLNCLQRFRNGFIGRQRLLLPCLSTAVGRHRPRIRLSWRESSLSGLLLLPPSGSLPIISVLDDRQNHERDAHRHGKPLIACAHENVTAVTPFTTSASHSITTAAVVAVPIRCRSHPRGAVEGRKKGSCALSAIGLQCLGGHPVFVLSITET